MKVNFKIKEWFFITCLLIGFAFFYYIIAMLTFTPEGIDYTAIITIISILAIFIGFSLIMKGKNRAIK